MQYTSYTYLYLYGYIQSNSIDTYIIYSQIWKTSIILKDTYSKLSNDHTNW